MAAASQLLSRGTAHQRTAEQPTIVAFKNTLNDFRTDNTEDVLLRGILAERSIEGKVVHLFAIVYMTEREPQLTVELVIYAQYNVYLTLALTWE